MSIGSIGSSFAPPSLDTINKARQSFDKLGSAIDSGNLSDAKDALNQLKKNAPQGSSDSSNPLSSKIDALTKAVDSGDTASAKTAYADLKKTLQDNAPQSGPAGARGGQRPSGGSQAGGSASSASTSSSSTSTKTYDKKDTNKDGKVSLQEEISYAANHPTNSSKIKSTDNDNDTDSSSTSDANTIKSNQGLDVSA